MAVVNYNELFDWFTIEIESFTKENTAIIRFWGRAQDHIGNDAKRWKTWVRKCIKSANGRNVHDREGCLYSRFKDTKPAELPKQSEPLARAMSNQTPEEAAEHKARAARARAGRADPIPPFFPAMRLAKVIPIADAISQVQAEWVRQGKPYPEDFDEAPLWQAQ
jgi:hypothetical protein